MRSTKLIGAVALGLALVACKKTETTTTNDTSITTNSDLNASDMNASSGMASTSDAMPAQGFTDTVAASDMFEIQSGKLAETMGSTAAVKDFGKMLVTDHTKSTDALKKAAAKTTPVVGLPMILPADLKAKITALKATKGADFDKLFIEQQVAGHTAALDALKAYGAGGDQPSLKEFATTVIPTVQSHLDKLNAMPK